MSAPNAGRQSPPPEEQSDRQINPSEGAGQIGAASGNFAKDESNKQKDNVLESNPTHSTLEKAAAEKVSKDGRGEGI